jgi:hypothetical protein
MHGIHQGLQPPPPPDERGIRLTYRYAALIVRYQAALQPGQPEMFLSDVEASAYKWGCEVCAARLKRALDQVKGST